jgi:hypothetical protein
MDVAITQDHQIMTLNCVRIFTNLRDGRAAMSGIEPMQISLFVRENLSWPLTDQNVARMDAPFRPGCRSGAAQSRG